MRNPIRATLAATALALFAAACATDANTVSPDDLTTLAPDAAIGATSGQASLPGFTMSSDVTFQGSVDASSTCAYSATTRRVECAPVTRDGLTITRSFSFVDAAGAAQTHRDSTTRSANTMVTVKGTVTTPRGTLTVSRASSVTVGGLGRAATTHTVSGSELGTASGTVTTDKGSATVEEQSATTTADVVVPAPFSATSWPLSGSTSRESRLSVTRGGTTRTSIATERATYNGTSVVPVTVTRDGRSRSCSRDLAAHTTSCQ